MVGSSAAISCALAGRRAHTTTETCDILGGLPDFVLGDAYHPPVATRSASPHSHCPSVIHTNDMGVVRTIETTAAPVSGRQPHPPTRRTRGAFGPRKP
jgi:hypothetical protein